MKDEKYEKKIAKYILIVIFFSIFVNLGLAEENWYKFQSPKELTIISGKSKKEYKLRGTSYNPIITERGTLVFGTGAGFIYEFNKNGLMYTQEEKGIFYHVFDSMNKIIALSGTPLNTVGTANIIIFSNDYKKRKVLFSDETNGRTFVSYFKNNNLILINLGGYYYGNDYFLIDVNQDKIIWTEHDDCSLMIPYKTIPNGFEFIKGQVETYTEYEKEELIKRYFKIKNIYLYQLIIENNKDISKTLKTNLIDFFDTTKEFSNLAAFSEDKVFIKYESDDKGGDIVYNNYINNLLSNGEILLDNSFPRLKEAQREKGKVIFKKME